MGTWGGGSVGLTALLVWMLLADGFVWIENAPAAMPTMKRKPRPRGGYWGA
jgi:hypothetical protein